MADDSGPYRPTLSSEDVAFLRAWHEAAYDEMRHRGRVQVSYLEREFEVPDDVFAPTPMSDLLGRAVLDEVCPGNRVLDMGTGCGVNAILAASIASTVVGVDINPHAVTAAVANAARNNVSDRTTFFVSDVFDAVKGRFDLIVFDPPFRWFRPRDLLEASIADEDYRALTRFMQQASDHMIPGGRILLSFGTSGDTAYLSRLIRRHGFEEEKVVERALTTDRVTVTYHVHRLTVRGVRAEHAGRD